MQTLSLLILSGWSERTNLYPSISIMLMGVEEPSQVSDKHMRSCL